MIRKKRHDPVRVLIVCSPGGHLLEMLALEPAWEGLDHLWVTYESPDARYLLTQRRVEFVYGPTNRHIGNALRNFPAAWRVLRSYRPDTILSTGAGVALPFFVLGWLLRKRLVFVESLARVDDISLTGRLVYPLCDEFFVQWRTAQRLKRARWEGNVL